MKTKSIISARERMNKKDVHVSISYETFTTLKIMMFKYETSLQAVLCDFLNALAKGSKTETKVLAKHLHKKIRKQVDKNFKRYDVYDKIKNAIIEKEKVPKEVEELYASIEANYRDAINDYCEENTKKEVFDIQKAVDEKLKDEVEEGMHVYVKEEIKRIRQM